MKKALLVATLSVVVVLLGVALLYSVRGGRTVNPAPAPTAEKPIAEKPTAQKPIAQKPAYIFWVGKVVPCPVCGGSKEVDCPYCEEGFILENTPVGARPFKCPVCSVYYDNKMVMHRGRLPCTFCYHGYIVKRVLSPTPDSDPQVVVCPDCAGFGVVANGKPCARCWGSGWTFPGR